MVTRDDVAKLAGVSPAVVSYTLNQSNYVSKEKTEAVLRAVEKLNYTPNYMAKSLKMNQTNNFALVCDDIRSELFAEIAYYMEAYAYQRGYNIFLCNSHQDNSFIKMLLSHRMDGIFIATSIYSIEQLNFIASQNMPVVLYKTREYSGLDQRIKSICVDYYGAAETLASHLINRGHIKIAYIPPYLSKITRLQSKDYRLNGFCSAMAANGLKVSPKNVCFDNRSYETMIDFVTRMVQRPSDLRPTAILAGNDYIAIKILNHLKAMGLRIPDDIAIAGMDDTVSSVNVSPQLTTMSFSKQEIAECAVDSLIQGREKSDSVDTVFKAILIKRMSA
jgi:LacI family transcriptional regulator/LacI family purine nucleotide synthesis repressor